MPPPPPQPPSLLQEYFVLSLLMIQSIYVVTGKQSLFTLIILNDNNDNIKFL